ncbi:Carbohydrate esterase, family CE14. Probable N-acetylsugar deacetylase [Tenacibaculum maritimum]|uniref:PIG-L deacetylase family protein n=1 Tax=Tenacibaculum maritimum TaxID=107401 RepID=UPI0012E435A3|nr:PIG-L deacetylase family protein [Tenacibaculum maritimum]CAA0219673.1 Carbohydrate esterase, family CE14. Probable N-acetylsugar deacetylase [Tenacibaculum maritimum]CAA0254871.1 Carbohydrate esterase, family CE14. Probable N-acetylsugar deacetylase [Tenacibaculum maritimum]CAA0260449.1 Carbohydrate esterase, family CE14. Probable N-acetylsugar deacetylase [Tenacibaculum maritimum]
MKNVLIVAPHADDEVLGCGGIMKRKSQEGDNVIVLIVTRGTPKMYSDDKVANVRNEAKQSHKILGVKKTFFLDFHAPELDITSSAEIARGISKIVKENSIDEMYIPHRGDIHSDHRVVANSCYVAARPVNGCSVKSIYAYETLSETEWAAPFGDDAFIPNHFVDITEFIDFKLKAMECFKSQLREFPNSRSLECMESLAKFRGATIGVNRAEAFMIIRTII